MKKVLIFGASPQGRFARLMLDEHEYNVVGFLDNGELANARGSIDGIPVFDPSIVGKVDYDFIIIAIPQYNHEIRCQLNNLGVPDNLITTFMSGSENISFHNDTRIAYLKLCMEDLKRKGTEGSIAELGVYRGDFAKFMNEAFPDRKLYLFDTFEGFDNKDNNIDKDEREGYEDLFMDTSVKLVLDKMVNPESVVVQKGWFPDTLSGVPDDEKYCLVSLDTDIYEPMLAGLEYFYPRLEKGGYIFVHDFYNNDWNGIMKAVDDFCGKYDIGYVPILDRCGSIIITK